VNFGGLCSLYMHMCVGIIVHFILNLYIYIYIYSFWFEIHTASTPMTSGTHTDGGAVISKPGTAWLEGYLILFLIVPVGFARCVPLRRGFPQGPRGKNLANEFWKQIFPGGPNFFFSKFEFSRLNSFFFQNLNSSGWTQCFLKIWVQLAELKFWSDGICYTQIGFGRFFRHRDFSRLNPHFDFWVQPTLVCCCCRCLFINSTQPPSPECI